MEEFTIISYPGPKDDKLLSLTEARSRYMLPFGGKFRVVDFTLRNSFSSGAKSTIIYSNFEDGLEEYVESYGPFSGMRFPPIRVVAREFSDIDFCYNLVMDADTDFYIIYNGDSPSIIDFTNIVRNYKRSKEASVLFRLKIDDKPSMAYKVLVTTKEVLLDAIHTAIEEERASPNLFEMIINSMINKGIRKSNFQALYWPIKNIPEYYSINREIIWNPDIFNLLYKEKIIQSQIKARGYARIGKFGKIVNSFISDYCDINGTVENSIIFPGVQISENCIIKDSIILPFVRIAPNVRITRAIIDERTDFPPDIEPETEEDYKLFASKDYYNIDSYCNIGSDQEQIKNNDFPRALFSSITLLGKDTRIVERSNIGGACYIASGLGEEFFSTKKYLYDGLSLVR